MQNVCEVGSVVRLLPYLIDGGTVLKDQVRWSGTKFVYDLFGLTLTFVVLSVTTHVFPSVLIFLHCK